MQNEALPPHDIKTEESLIGSLLIDPNAYSKVAGIVVAEDFFRQGHRHIYSSVANLFQANKAIDHIAVASDLRERGLLEEAGGVDTLATIVKVVPTSVHAEHYAKEVRISSRRRRLIEAGKHIAELGYETDKELDEVLVSAENEILKLRGIDEQTNLTLIKSVMDEHLNAISRPIGSDAEKTVSTGYRRLDDLIGGFYPGDMIVLAARPSIGKSMLALNFVLRIAREGNRVAVFSLEMGSNDVGMRLLATEADVSMHAIRTRRLGGQERERLVDAVGAISDMQIYVDEASVQTAGEMRAKAFRLHKQRPLDFVVIDYIQLMDGGMRRDYNRVQEVSEISRNIKALARDLQVPVLAISQLNREVERRASKPMLSNLRDSGSIEQDADVVMFIHREDKITNKRDWDINNPGKPYPRNLAELIISKHRHGPTGSIMFAVKDDRGLIEERIIERAGQSQRTSDAYH